MTDTRLDPAHDLYVRAARRLIPFMFLCYVLAQIDRGNIAHAKGALSHTFGFDNQVYALGVGMFYFGYAILEVPSNLILERVGARLWISRIMITWGLITVAFAFMVGEKSFYALRFLLGLAEAGFMPGAVLYLTYWFPAARQARATAAFLTSIPIALVIAGPLSGTCLDLDGLGGWAGWQWMFAVAGIPSVIVGVIVLWYLPNGPKDARWLSPEERERIDASLAADRALSPTSKHGSFLESLAAPRLWALTAIYFLLITGFYGIINWLPAIFSDLPFLRGTSNLARGSAAAAPYILTCVAMVWWGRRSDRSGERRWHAAIAGGLAAASLGIAACWPHRPEVVLVCLTLTSIGTFSALGPFWSLATSCLQGPARAGGIGLINGLGCLGGYVGPMLLAKLDIGSKHHGQGYAALGLCLLMFAVLVLALKPSRPATVVPSIG
ncbi:MAG: MFS transporter [Planctomycetes bacterium]|nr:MFS transporter [Planctomycetota bacterium]